MAAVNTSGYNTPDSQLESVVPVHPTSQRREHAIAVQSENTSFSDEFITAKFVNRGTSVNVSNGQYVVTPTAQEIELRTQRKVSKTGCVSYCS